MNPTQEIARVVRTALSNGEIISVTFRKVDGTTTHDRKITRNLIVIPKDKHPKFVRGRHQERRLDSLPRGFHCWCDGLQP
jgi:hypothetical protein